MKMTKMLFVKSSDYWGYDAASFDDSVNFYRYSWVVPAAQYSSMSSDDQGRLFPCALFYVQGVTDNHNFLTLKISEDSSESIVSGMQGGKRRTRRYTLGSPAQYSVGTYALQEAPSGASTIADIQSAVESGSTSEGSFTVSEFLTDGTKIAEAVGMMTEGKSAESFAAPAEVPSGSAYLPVDPTVANPASEGPSESDLITMDDFSAEDHYSVRQSAGPCAACGDEIVYYESKTGELADGSYLPTLCGKVVHDFGNCGAEYSDAADAMSCGCDTCERLYEEYEEVDFDAEGDSRLRDIRGKFMNRKKAKNAVFGEVMSQQMSGYYRTGIVGDNPPVGQNIARRNPVAKARYFIEPGVQNPNSGKWSKGPNFQQARKIAKGVAWDTVQDMGLAAETAGLPVIPNSYGENSAPVDGHGVPQWYGSAEYDFSKSRKMECGECDATGFIRGKECGVCDGAGYWMNPAPICSCGNAITGTSGAECDACEEWYCDSCIKNDSCPHCGDDSLMYHSEGLPMTTLGQSEFPVIEDSYGGNSAWESGYGVPQWYGSAEYDFSKSRKMECGKCDAKGFAKNGNPCRKCDGTGYWMIPAPICSCGTVLTGSKGAECGACEEWSCDSCIGKNDACPRCNESVLMYHSETFAAQGISKTLEEAAPVSLKKPALMAALGLVAGIWMARR
jgi:hypothetical protein